MAEAVTNDTTSSYAESKIQTLEALRIQLVQERSTFLEQWRELGDYISPARQRYFTQQTNKGNRRNKNIIDSTASKTMRTLSAGMMSGMTSPSREWFKVGVQNPQLMAMPAVKEWLDQVNQIIRLTFNQSNLYQCLPNVYNDLGTFATAAMMAEEDYDQVIRFYTFPIGSYMIANDARGKVAVFMREFRMTIRQCVTKFQKSPGDWSNFSDYVRNAWENNRREAWVDVYHVISPNSDYDGIKSGSQYKKFQSCYWEKGAPTEGSSATANPDKFLRESGYDLFPVMVPRWQLAAEDVYGTDCPGMMMIGDVKQLQQGEKQIMKAIAKHIDPPVKGPESMKSTAASVMPGGYTWVSETAATGKFEPVYQIDPRIQEMEMKQGQVRQRIKDIGFETLFLMFENDERTQPPTAEEVIERRSEKMLAIGPVLEQINQDLLDPLLEIAFAFLSRQRWIPPTPPELSRQPLKIDYISIMAQAQKILGVANKERFAGFVIKMALESQNMDVLDNIDFDELVQEYADALGIEQKNLRTADMIANLRAGRQQAQQAAQQAQIAAQSSVAAKNLSQADLSKDSALKRLMGSNEAAQSPQI